MPHGTRASGHSLTVAFERPARGFLAAQAAPHPSVAAGLPSGLHVRSPRATATHALTGCAHVCDATRHAAPRVQRHWTWPLGVLDPDVGLDVRAGAGVAVDVEHVHALAVAAAVYVGAWIVGLAANTAQVPAGATAEDVRVYYLQHSGAVVAQATLVHAVAGVALAFLAVGLASLLRPGAARSVVAVSGLAAAVLSVGQAGLAYAAVIGSSDDPTGWSANLRHAIDLADVAKLGLLAVLVATVTAAYRREGTLPRWLVGVGAVLAVLLVLGAVSFLVPSAPLAGPLALSLLLLLVWTASLGVLSARGSLRTGGAAGSGEVAA